MTLYADVIVPLPLIGTFTYEIPVDFAEKIIPGCRVVVPFGVKKFYTAIVVRTHTTPPTDYEVKSITELLDSSPILTDLQLRFWEWLAEYYLCTLGEVCKAALPSGLKPESETVIAAVETYEGGVLSDRENRLWHLLHNEGEQSLKDLQKHFEVNVLPIVQSLFSKGAVAVSEELKGGYRPRTEQHIVLEAKFHTTSALNFQLKLLHRSPRQEAVLLKYLELSGWNDQQPTPVAVPRKLLLSAAADNGSALSALVRKQILHVEHVATGRLSMVETPTVSVHPLTEVQSAAYNQILQSFRQKPVCLLHGVTSSGKTEVYIHLIQHYLDSGKQVLYLLPEIALTTQITERLRRIFGSRLGVYHSKFSDAERVEVWQKQLSSAPYDIILGVRSSVFLPFDRLGLVIVDEEHETTYKQQDPAPRYHARNAAIMLATMYAAHTLLGTATPSIETYFHARSGKYGLVELFQRYGRVNLPQVKPVDIRELGRKKMMLGPFSPELLAEVRRSLDAGGQAILFQNRRGFAPVLECNTCGWVPRCQFCDVSLTYHKQLNRLTCHYCGATYQVPSCCPACEETNFNTRGVGTEKIEDAIKELLPHAKVARMDLDTTRSKLAYDRILTDFQEGRTDILVGTQMISKGLDFDRVRVVGILQADQMLNYPDFRAHERAFQLMSQVAGRAGRRQEQGLVILQTRQPDVPVIQQVVSNDYWRMFDEQLAERKAFGYPPYSRLLDVYLKHRKQEVCEEAAECTADLLRRGLAHRVLGPDKPVVGRIQSLYIRKIVLKIENGISLSQVRTYLQQVQQAIRHDIRFHSILFYYDMDPL